MERKNAAIALIFLLAGSTQVTGDEQNIVNGFDGAFTFRRMNIPWPVTENICFVPVKLKVGSVVEVDWSDETEPATVYVEARDLRGKRIVLKQVDCRDIRKDNEKDWPCFSGCEKIAIRSTLDIKLGTKLEKTSNVIDQWEAYLGRDIVPGTYQWYTIKICVMTWKANIQNTIGGEQIEIGKLTITMMPHV